MKLMFRSYAEWWNRWPWQLLWVPWLELQRALYDATMAVAVVRQLIGEVDHVERCSTSESRSNQEAPGTGA